MEKENEKLSPTQAAKYLGVSRRTLERYVEDGRLTKHEQLAPRQVFFYVSDLDALKEGHPLVKYTLRLPVMVAHFDRYLEEQGLKPISEFLNEPEIIPAPLKIANLMRIPEKTPVIHRLLRQGIHIDNKLVYYRLSENYYNSNVVTSTILAEMQKNPRFDTMKALKDQGGKVVVRSHLDAIARLPTDREQELLNVSRVVPMLEVIGTNYAEDDTVIFINQRFFIGDLSELSFDFPVDYWK